MARYRRPRSWWQRTRPKVKRVVGLLIMAALLLNFVVNVLIPVLVDRAAR